MKTFWIEINGSVAQLLFYSPGDLFVKFSCLKLYQITKLYFAIYVLKLSIIIIIKPELLRQY